MLARDAWFDLLVGLGWASRVGLSGQCCIPSAAMATVPPPESPDEEHEALVSRPSITAAAGTFADLWRDVWWSFRMHDGRLLAGAMAFYVVMATTPFGVIALYAGSLVLGREASRRELVENIAGTLGADVARMIDTAIADILATQHGFYATALSVGFLFYVTTRLFLMLRASLNHLWGVRSHVPVGFRGLGLQVLKRRMLAFAMVFMSGGAFAVFAVVRTVARWVELPFFGRLAELLISITVASTLIMYVFRWLPDARVAWRDAFVGGVVTGTLAAVGSTVIGAYLGSAGVSSGYGAAGAVVVLTLWIYYTCQIFFLGAEFTGAWARHKGGGIEPLAYATRVRIDARAAIED